ncbi:hypothetical protein DWF04_016865 [Cereibacter sphaeroides f. sp. denitrificans]|nr:hypothetical protein DWF04_22955 [Cereibacter sphaeroides f. sp. denitrificans]
MSQFGKLIVSVIRATCGLLAVWAAWRAAPRRDEVLPDMVRVEKFLAEAAQLRARQSAQEIESRIRISSAIYEEARRREIESASRGRECGQRDCGQSST